MYHFEEHLIEDLSQTHRKIERKPWNVKEGDIVILSQYGMGFANSGWMPVEITLVDSYPEYRRSDTIPMRDTKYSHKTFRFYHKALHETDKSRLNGWESTYHYSFDDVEIWRKK